LEQKVARLLRDKRSGETLRGAKRQVAHRLPRGKRATWSGNQPLSKSIKAQPYTFYKTFYGKKIDYYWHIRMGFVYNEEYDSSKE